MPLLPRDLHEFLAPFKLLVDKRALSPMYKCLELSPDKIRGCSSFGMLEVSCQLGIEDTMYVEAATFLAVIDSLPQEEEFVLANLDGVLAWACGSAKGKMALVAIENMPKIERRNKPSAWDVPALFADVLRLGALSCDSNTLASVGMHGVAIDNRAAVTICTSDNVTISTCIMDGQIPGAPDLITIAPEAAALLALIIGKGGKIEMDALSIYYRDEGCRLVLKQVTPLKHDLVKVLGDYQTASLVAPIPRDRIVSFIKRTAALSEAKKNTYVTLHAADGQLALSFVENNAGSDEYYLVDGLKIPAGMEIKLDATKLARALAHVEEVVLDHVGRGAVIFRGHKPEFTYMVAGRA